MPTLCTNSLREKRYTWRHDSVLLTLQGFFAKRISEANRVSIVAPRVPNISKSFVKAGKQIKAHSRNQRRSYLDGANDWELLVDFDSSNIIFPPDVYATRARPDILVFSRVTKRIAMIELTCR